MGAVCEKPADVAPDEQQGDEVRQVTEAAPVPSDEEFLKAAGSGSADQLSEMIKNGASISAKDSNNRTALHLAAVAGDAASIAALIDAKAEIDAVDSHGLTPLSAAVEAGQLESCRALVEKGAGLEVASAAARTPLQTAVASKHVEVLKLLLDSQASVQVRDEAGKSPLLVAVEAEMGDMAALLAQKGVESSDAEVLGRQLLEACGGAAWERARLLISYGADCNLRQEADEKAPLRLAAEKEQLELIKSLLEKGACREAKAKDGKTAYIYAVDKGKAALAALLAEKGLSKEEQAAVNKKLVTAVTKGDLAKAKLLLACKASPVAKSDGRPLLQVAVQAGKLELVELFAAKSGKKTTAKDGKSILKFAFDQSDPKADIITALQGKGFAVTATELNDVNEKLCEACRAEKADQVKMAILVGANVNSTYQDLTPLSSAVGAGNLEIVKMLVEAKAQINVRVGMYSVTPLYMAAVRKKKEIAKYLISQGANKDNDDPDGQKEFAKLK